MPRFSELLREHANYPLNRGAVGEANGVGEASISGNPPYVTIYLVIEADVVNKAGFEADGCGVTTAACSSLTELIENKTISFCRKLSPNDVAQSLDGIPVDKMHCAQIVVGALNNAIDNYEGKK